MNSMIIKEYPSNLIVGVDFIDSQHKEIVEKIKNLIQIIESNGTIDEILESFDCFLNYVKYHFDTEETYFDLFNYKDKLRHIAAHQIFLNTLIELEKNYFENPDKINESVLFFLEKWSNTHILSLDLELAKELIDNKIV